MKCKATEGFVMSISSQEAFGQGSGRPEDWETPWWLFNAINARFQFTLDSCATDTNTKVKNNYFTEAEDGLRQDWSNNIVWCNPPYGGSVEYWMAKAVKEASKGVTTVFLVFVRSDTAYWQKYVPLASEIHLIAGRVNFSRGDKQAGAPMPSCVIVFTPESVQSVHGPTLFHWDPEQTNMAGENITRIENPQMHARSKGLEAF